MRMPSGPRTSRADTRLRTEPLRRSCAPCPRSRASVSSRSSTANMATLGSRERSQVRFGDPQPQSAREIANSSIRPWPSGVRIMAISTRWLPRSSPVTRPDQSPSMSHGLPFDFEAQLGEKGDSGIERFHHDADVVHPLHRPRGHSCGREPSPRHDAVETAARRGGHGWRYSGMATTALVHHDVLARAPAGRRPRAARTKRLTHQRRGALSAPAFGNVA